ncbi:peptidase [Streptomyces sp. NPDC005899]|uniref:peptidase n=1 Tax=Streptomyces sp. NPDC005899 TaxID=3155716 RepID=UPI0033FE2745
MTCPDCRFPIHTQFATPDLVGPIVEDGLDPALDPGWAASGAASPAEYARWAGHLCGMTCLRMALGTGAPALFALRDGAVRYGAYTEDSEGTVKGLLYAPFAEYAAGAHGLGAVVHRELTPAGILGLLEEGRSVMASVHHAIRYPDRPAPGRGGHLVLVTAGTADGTGVHFHNPSGTTAATRAATLPLTAFEPFFAGRGVSLPRVAERNPGDGGGAGTARA